MSWKVPRGTAPTRRLVLHDRDHVTPVPHVTHVLMLLTLIHVHPRYQCYSCYRTSPSTETTGQGCDRCEKRPYS